MSYNRASSHRAERKRVALVLSVMALQVGVLKAEEEPPASTVETTQAVTARAVGLPPLPDDEADSSEDPAATEPAKVVTLFPAGQFDLTTATLSLDSTLISQRGIHYQIDRQSDSTWLVLGVPATSSVVTTDQSESSEPIGRVWLGESGLQFAWTDGAESRPRVASPLRGAVLVGTASDESKHAVALRDCIQWSPMPLDMTRSPARVQLPIQSLPGDVSLTVEINRIESSNPRFQLSDYSEPDRLADRDSAKRPDKAQTEVELRLQHKGSRYTLETRFYYVDSTDTRRPFEARGVRSSLEQKKRQLQKAELILSKAQSALPVLRKRLASAEGRRSSDPHAQQRMLQEAKKLGAAVRRAESAMSKNGKTIPKIKKAIGSMNSIVSVGSELHRQAKVHACVFAVTSAWRVPLVRIGDST